MSSLTCFECTMRVVVKKDRATGLWVSHCLTLDLVSQGKTPDEAAEAVFEAIRMVVQDDLEMGLDPLSRARAPDECWSVYFHAIQDGREATEDALHHGDDLPEGTVFAGEVRVVRPYSEALDGPISEDDCLPRLEPWQFQQLQDLRLAQGAHC